MEKSFQEALGKLSRQAELLNDPIEELQNLQQSLARDVERFLSSVAMAAGGRPLGFSLGALSCVIRKGSNGASCNCRLEEEVDEIKKFTSDLFLDIETATRVYILSHREEILEACTQALEHQGQILSGSIDHIRSLLDLDTGGSDPSNG